MKGTGPKDCDPEGVVTREHHSPVADVLVVEPPVAELDDVVSAPETALVVTADAVVLPPALAALLPPPTAELTAAVALADAGQLAADGSFTLTLYKMIVSGSSFCEF